MEALCQECLLAIFMARNITGIVSQLVEDSFVQAKAGYEQDSPRVVRGWEHYLHHTNSLAHPLPQAQIDMLPIG